MRAEIDREIDVAVRRTVRATHALEVSPATKRILKMEGTLCSIIRAANGEPSRELLDEIQKMALVGVGLKQQDPK